MPSFIANCHVHTKSIVAVRRALGHILKNKAYIIQSGANWVTVFPDAAQQLNDVAKRLSQSLDTGVIATGIDNGDFLYFTLFENGQRTRSGARPAKPANNSNRLRIAGSLDALAKYATTLTTTAALLETLEGSDDSALQRLESAAKIMGIDPTCATTGFRHIESEISDIDGTPLLVTSKGQ